MLHHPHTSTAASIVYKRVPTASLPVQWPHQWWQRTPAVRPKEVDMLRVLRQFNWEVVGAREETVTLWGRGKSLSSYMGVVQVPGKPRVLIGPFSLQVGQISEFHAMCWQKNTLTCSFRCRL